ncbi:MAG: hypothetical protein WCO78_03875 [Candidatus Roizmanbacteria bacterium]
MQLLLLPILLIVIGAAYIYKKGKDSMYSSLMTALQRGEQSEPDKNKKWSDFRRLVDEVYHPTITYTPTPTVVRPGNAQPQTAVMTQRSQYMHESASGASQQGKSGSDQSLIPSKPSSGAHLDTANILLFIGAFLIIAAATTFASFASASLSGGMKLILMILFGSGFYVSGIEMNRKVPFLKPASIVFTAIGMIMVPYIGYVYFRDIDSHNFALVWLITSLIASVMYGIALRSIKHPLLGYVFSASIASASISFARLIGDTTPYFLSYGLMLASFVSLAVHKVTEDVLAIDASHWRICTFAYHIFALALGMVTYFTGGDLYFLVILTSVSMIFAAVQINIVPPEQRTFFATWASVALIVNAGLWFDQAGMPRQFIALLILIISAVYIAIGGRIFAVSQRLNYLNKIWMIVGQVSSIAPLLIGFEMSWFYYVIVITTVVLHLGVVAKYRLISSHIISACVLAFVVSITPAVTQLDAYWYSICAVGCTLLGYAYMAASRPGLWGEKTSQICSILFLISGFISALFIDSWYLQMTLYIYLGLAAIMYVRRTGAASIAICASACVFFALHVVLGYFGYEVRYISLVYTLSSGLFMVWTSKSKPLLRQSGLYAAYTGIASSFVASLFYTHVSPFYAGPICCLMGSVSILYTTDFATAQTRSRIALGSTLVAALWAMNLYGLVNVQWYIIPMSAYLLLLSYDAHQVDNTYRKDLWMFLALATLTLPTAVQALSSIREIYRLLILGYGIGIVIAGAYFRYKLMQWWGIGTIVLVVLYVIGPYLFQIPSWGYYLLLGGVFLIAAVKVLSRHREHL